MLAEYFQWRPQHNEDSKQMAVSAGDVLHGQVTFDESSQSYTLVQADMTTGKSVSMTIPVQKTAGGYKNYTIGAGLPGPPCPAKD